MHIVVATQDHFGIKPVGALFGDKPRALQLDVSKHKEWYILRLQRKYQSSASRYLTNDIINDVVRYLVKQNLIEDVPGHVSENPLDLETFLLPFLYKNVYGQLLQTEAFSVASYEFTRDDIVKITHILKKKHHLNLNPITLVAYLRNPLVMLDMEVHDFYMHDACARKIAIAEAYKREQAMAKSTKEPVLLLSNSLKKTVHVRKYICKAHNIPLTSYMDDVLTTPELAYEDLSR